MILAVPDRHAAPPHAWLEEPLPPVELSIEVFPPKGPEAAARLWANVEQFVAMVGTHGDAPMLIARILPALLLLQKGGDERHHVRVAAEMVGLHEGAVRVLRHVAQMSEPDPVGEAPGDGRHVVDGIGPKRAAAQG